MNKVTEIILGTAAVAAGAVMIFMLIKKGKRNRLSKLQTGKYAVDMFKKITHDMNKAIRSTERRLAKHDKGVLPSTTNSKNSMNKWSGKFVITKRL